MTPYQLAITPFRIMAGRDAVEDASFTENYRQHGILRVVLGFVLLVLHEPPVYLMANCCSLMTCHIGVVALCRRATSLRLNGFIAAIYTLFHE